MKFSKSRDSMSLKKRRSCCRPIPVLSLLCTALFIIGALVVTNCCNQRLSRNGLLSIFVKTSSKKCEKQCRVSGSQSLPKGIVSSTSDLEMRPLWGASVKKKPHTNLLAMAVGIKQKTNVDKIVRKFLESSFVVMLFHYDGNVDDWSDLKWSAHALHVAASNQTKWWFAKRFLHPAVVSEYSYIFLWDEDLGVEYFNVQRYLSVIKKERLEISQPALDPDKSDVHHPLTARQKGVMVHRRINKVLPGKRICNENSTEPPCTGWVEMMAPVFSIASWRCAWLMIQNEFVHAWGVDFQLGYCAQGDRTKKIGIVDSDYVIHYGLPTLGGAIANKVKSTSNESDGRNAVRKQSITDLERFKNRWKKAVKDDEDWTDPFQI